jgi:hypothetical protein
MAWQEALFSGPAGSDGQIFREFIDGTIALGLGRIRRLFFEMTPPRLFIAGCARIWRDQHTAGDLTAPEVTPNGCRGELRNHPFTTTSLSRLGVSEALRHALSLTGLRGVEETHHVDSSGALVMRFTWR